MRAVVITKHGGPEVLQVQERPDPPVGPGEVRVAVKASGINFADMMARSGVYPDAPPLPSVIGYEVAGEVESVGDGVDQYSVGDRVIAGTRFGGYAEMVTVPAGQVLPLPKKLSFEQGAGFVVNYTTAYAGLVMMGGAAGRGPDAGPGRGRRRGDRFDPGRQGDRRRDLRDGVGGQARRDPRAGLRPPDRLSLRRTSPTRSCGSPMARASTS